MNRPKLSIILRILFSLTLLILLLWLTRDNLTEIGRRLVTVNLSLFGLAFFLFMFSILLLSWRLGIILSAQGAAARFSIKDLFSLTLIGYFFTNFMPTSVGGDLVKGYYISKRIKNKLGSYASVFVDRVIGMFSFALIAGIALVAMKGNIEYKFIIWTVVFLLCSCCVFTLFIFQKRLFKKLGRVLGLLRLLRILKLETQVKKAYTALRVYATHQDIIAKTLGLSVVSQLISFFTVFLLAQSLSAYIPLGKVLLVMPVIFVLCMLPITMNGLGLREWAFKLFFMSSIGGPAALSLSLLYLAMFLLSSLIGGIIYLFWR